MDLFTQATRLGIQTEFRDVQGHLKVADPAALKIVVDAMPVGAPHRLMASPPVLHAGAPRATALSEAAALPVAWSILSGERAVAQGVADRPFIDWPTDLPLGSYCLHLEDAAGLRQQLPLLVAPRAHRGDFDRAWIVAVQLYSLRSSRNWGIGDFTDLAELIELAASLGASGIGLNPLHALFDDHPHECSPYAPNSRMFLNPLYVDVEQLPEFAQGELPDGAALAALRDGELVDYVAVAAVKWRLLRQCFDIFRNARRGERHAAFDAFRSERGPQLARFACFEALRHKYKTPWWDWPAAWRRPDDARCAELRNGPDGAEIEFIEFSQWCADEQLRACRDLARARGMSVGLYLDVAVGVQAGGFDAWDEQRAISRQLSVGAPPDPLNTAGQNWGLAGFNAPGLELTGFDPFRQMLRASMRYAGAIRLDHVLGLNRLYLVPHGFGPDNGVYVKMPLEALFAVTAQESAAHRCVVIGEDLGTVPEGFREYMAAWGIWSYRVMMFERDYHQGWFFGIECYPPEALVTFSTHDLATYSGWRNLSDLRDKRAVGLDPGESDDARRYAMEMLGHALRHEGIEQDDIYAVLTFLSRTPSRLLAISLEDVLGVLAQPNIPGTVDEHPNWRRRLPCPTAEFVAVINQPALLGATAQRRAEATAIAG